MASISSTGVARPQTGGRLQDHPAGSRAFDWLAVLTSAWFLGGLFLDGWAHNHIAELESFFTPWHAVLYSGFFSVGILMVYTQYRNVGRGYAWSRALPRGYFSTLIGCVIFLISGVGDMLWHEIFGIEQNIEALFSPTHLLLASGAFLFVTGPLRAAWGRSGLRGWRDLLPAILSMLMTFSLLTFFLQYASIWGNPGFLTERSGSDYFFNVTTVAAILIPAALMVGALLMLLRRWMLPFGTAALLFTANATLMLLMRFDFAAEYWRVLVAAAVGGLLTDGLIAALKPSLSRAGALRLVAFTAPFTVFLLTMGAVALTDQRGLYWPIHMWLGVPFVAGAIGLLLSFLAVPPPLPDEAQT
ncbi:MAG: hypothetical protein JNM70_01315 [Anaerolineae bacterium]|nr:hypothetical protein [Anaerolineae bacterium]